MFQLIHLYARNNQYSELILGSAQSDSPLITAYVKSQVGVLHKSRVRFMKGFSRTRV